MMEVRIYVYLCHLRTLVDVLHVDAAGMQDVKEIAEQYSISEGVSQVMDRASFPVGLVIRPQQSTSSQPFRALAP